MWRWFRRWRRSCPAARRTSFRRSEPWPPPGCASALFYGFKRDLNAYLAIARTGFDGAVAGGDDRVQYRASRGGVEVRPDPGAAVGFDRHLAGQRRYRAVHRLARARHRAVSRRARLRLQRRGRHQPGTADDFDALLFSANSGAGTPAKAGYPSITVPGGFVPPAAPIDNPFPSGVTFSGRAFSEPRLIGLAYAFEQATQASRSRRRARRRCRAIPCGGRKDLLRFRGSPPARFALRRASFA